MIEELNNCVSSGISQMLSGSRGKGEMLAARWSANILLVLICVALLLDFCSCAKVPKETAAELEDFLSEDFNNGFANGAFAQNTEKLAEDDGENVEDENGWAEEEEDEDEMQMMKRKERKRVKIEMKMTMKMTTI